MVKSTVTVLLALLFIFTRNSIYAKFDICQLNIHGKLDVGPTLIDVDILESGKTVETLHMKGFKGDATILILGGFCLKPGFIWATGHGNLSSFSMGVGQYIPLYDKLLLLPNIGVTWTDLHTRVDFEQLGLFDLKEKFRSTSPFIGLEICYKLTKRWTLMATTQYAWSWTHTTIDALISKKSKSRGPNYSLGVDYSLNQHWSLLFGIGYNSSLSKEKHGIRGKGAKIGVAYYF